MRMIIKQYLSGLKERGELDRIIPELLSSMGLTVLSKPKIGTRQYGVDVAAHGRIGGDTHKLYLFSIKGGDLDRNTWDGNSLQALRTSLDEIRDVYIQINIPPELQNLPIVICICVGGEIVESVRSNVTGYIKNNQNNTISFMEWNGDSITNLMIRYLLNEHALPPNYQSNLRKSIAMISHPEVSTKNYNLLIDNLIDNTKLSVKKQVVKTIREMNISLWILFIWCRDLRNLEAAYLASERTLLKVWDLVKEDIDYFGSSFDSIFRLYMLITDTYVDKLSPFFDSKFSISESIVSGNSVDISIRVFSLASRLAVHIWWLITFYNIYPDNQKDFLQCINERTENLEELIRNNPILASPLSEKQASELSLILSVLCSNKVFLKEYLESLTDRAIFAFNSNLRYPCSLYTYQDLSDHPINSDKQYKMKVTDASMIYPLIAFYSALFSFDNVYDKIYKFRHEKLSHCSFQLWTPNNESIEEIYSYSSNFGTAIIFDLPKNPQELLKIVYDTCAQKLEFENMSAIKNRLGAIITVACRHHQLPLPVQFVKQFYDNQVSDSHLINSN